MDELPQDPSPIPQGEPPPDALSQADAPGPDPSIFLPALGPVLGPPPQIPIPPPPPMPPSAASDPKQHLLAIAALGAMLGLGKQGGAGVGAGLLSAQQHMDAEHQKQFNYATQVQQHQAAQAAQAQRQADAIYARRAQSYLGAVKSISQWAASGKVPTKAEYDTQINAYATQLQLGGFRVDANTLRQQAPYVAPSQKKVLADAVNSYLKNPANKTLIEQHPDQLSNVWIAVDRDADGVPERMKLLDAAAIGEVPFNVDERGNLIQYPKGTSADSKANADGIYEDLIAQAAAEKKDTTDPKLRAALREEAMKRAKAASAPEKDPLAQELGRQRLTDAADKKKHEAESLADIGQQLFDGDLVPSQLSKRTGNYNEALAEANRISKETTGKPYSAVNAEVQFAAAKRFAQSLNSQQMVRFKGLGTSVVNTIDEVKRLSDQMNQGGFADYNAAKLAATMRFEGNSEKGQLIAAYMGAVNTLKEEFANLVNGGMAPTEPAFALANQQINGAYGVKAMGSSLTEVQRLIKFRLGAFTNMQPTLPGNGTAPSAESPAPADHPPMQKYGATYTWDGGAYRKQ